jgi:hypothetical protein
MVVPFPRGQGALLFCRRCTLARPPDCSSRDNIVGSSLLMSMWTATVKSNVQLLVLIQW